MCNIEKRAADRGFKENTANKEAETNINTPKKFNFGSLFQRFQFMVAWSCCSGPLVEHRNMCGGISRKELLASSVCEAKDRKEQTFPMTYFFQVLTPPPQVSTVSQSPCQMGSKSLGPFQIQTLTVFIPTTTMN